jgi:hypothetical protein
MNVTINLDISYILSGYQFRTLSLNPDKDPINMSDISTLPESDKEILTAFFTKRTHFNEEISGKKGRPILHIKIPLN